MGLVWFGLLVLSGVGWCSVVWCAAVWFGLVERSPDSVSFDWVWFGLVRLVDGLDVNTPGLLSGRGVQR